MDVTQTGRDVIPQGIALLDPEKPDVQELMRYTSGVLDALGIENGAAHTELKRTAEGPALIETGARVMGAAMDRHSYQAAGMASQAGAYAAILADPDAQDSLFAKGHYHCDRHLSKVLFNFKEAARVIGTDGLARLRELPSFHAHYRALKPGSLVHRTADWLAQGGVVYFVHDDETQIAKDIARMRAFENEGLLYGLCPIPEHCEEAA